MKKFTLIILAYCFSGSSAHAQGQKLKASGKKYEFGTKTFISKNKQMMSDPISPAEIQSFRILYDAAPIPGLETSKGFYLDNKLIDSIRKYDGTNNKPKIESVYLYLSKKPLNPANPKHDGRYTLIAIPAIRVRHQPSGRDTNFLMTEQSLEWHDPISLHPPVNEDEITH